MKIVELGSDSDLHRKRMCVAHMCTMHITFQKSRSLIGAATFIKLIKQTKRLGQVCQHDVKPIKHHIFIQIENRKLKK